jgi:UDP-N-acetylglucosamine diphosphorylase / glucose-1-phosphate thymidylyltransferase / UDP-N-acetylgalactosamine diphosphorylase / glucosamine-1-phosphate N-acetyltransferase / galactosamine-1-phosphate N-acetyltransferase
MPLTAALFDLDRVPAPLRELLDTQRPWDVLARLDAFGASLLDDRVGTVHPTAIVEGPLVVEEGAEVGPYTHLTGPVYLAAGARIDHAARVRGPVVLGPDAKVGHASEVKRSLFLGGAKAPHFNYVGDSVIGHDVNLGAGVKLANTKTLGGEIVVAGIGTGLRKLGALLGDGVSIGCNAVLSPGTVIGKRTVVYDGADVRGVIAEDRIVKHRSALEETPRRP